MAGKARVHELAKELNVSSKDVLAKLSELGEFVKSASSTVEPPVARRLREAFPPAPLPPAETPTPPAQQTATPPEPAPAPQAEPLVVAAPSPTVEVPPVRPMTSAPTSPAAGSTP